MQVRFTNSPAETAGMSTQELRGNFLLENLMVNDQVSMVYSHYDRMIMGGAKPVSKGLQLPSHSELKAEFFLERREIGIINVGGEGTIEVDGELFSLHKLDCLYIGKGMKTVNFKSDDSSSPAVFYFLSAPAHATFSNHLMKKEQASPVTIGDTKTANHRTIYKYIHADGIKSCQLVMGLTVLGEGSVWNTMPAHTHTRRMEAYFYFDVHPEHRVIHFMGEPQQTRHLIVANHEAVISPPWSIHAGCGTANYAFIWGMAGENYTYTDMDSVAIAELR
jgi:4-deoxy-L-threo-5-hexosulose-uronate ketol-isomerase